MGFIDQWSAFLNEYKEAAVATIVNGTGSMPRNNGAQMLISESGSILETIGGGRLEADVISLSKRVIFSKTGEVYHFEMSGEDAAFSNLICGGKGDAVLYYSGEQDRPILERLRHLEKPEGWLILPIDQRTGAAFAAAGGALLGNPPKAVLKQISGRKETFIELCEGGRYLLQWISPPGKLHIMGAGHVSRMIARIASIAGMECLVYDDRSDFVSKERFPDAVRVLLRDFSALSGIRVDPEDMIAVVTRGHLYDREVLKWALTTKAGYIGMIGSRRKTEMIFSSLIREGYPEQRVRSVFSPIGLPIGAETPAEIAVSVVAQLIQFRSAGHSRRTSGFEQAKGPDVK